MCIPLFPLCVPLFLFLNTWQHFSSPIAQSVCTFLNSDFIDSQVFYPALDGFNHIPH